MDKDLIRALRIGLEYAEEWLAQHDATKGRQFPHLALEAQQIEEDIRDIKEQIAKTNNQ